MTFTRCSQISWHINTSVTLSLPWVNQRAFNSKPCQEFERVLNAGSAHLKSFTVNPCTLFQPFEIAHPVITKIDKVWDRETPSHNGIHTRCQKHHEVKIRVEVSYLTLKLCRVCFCSATSAFTVSRQVINLRSRKLSNTLFVIFSKFSSVCLPCLCVLRMSVYVCIYSCVHLRARKLIMRKDRNKKTRRPSN